MSVTRRQLVGKAGVLGVGLVAGGVLGDAIGGHGDAEASAADVYRFEGRHQPGIATPQQARMHAAAFDLTIDSRAQLRTLMQNWSMAARRMTQGETAARLNGNDLAPPADTGEALGLPPARLTLTFGFGRSLFTRKGDPFGIASKLPAALVNMPTLPTDDLDPARSDGDLFVQACADDPQVAFHAVRNLARIGRDSTQMRWAQLGFGRAATNAAGKTPRNLLGFKDGTNNIRPSQGSLFDNHVWARGSDGARWMRGGSYVVCRRIRMQIEVWDRQTLQDQQSTFGRLKVSGAPMGSAHEHDTPKLGAGSLIPKNAHIRLASHATTGGKRLLRRGYNYTDGMDPVTGELDAGLFFVCYQRDPRTAFIPLQRRLGTHDALNEYIVHKSSALFACPPGASRGGWVGETLLA